MSQFENLPQRKNIRMTGYDYSQPGSYFVTICTFDGQPLFGEIVGATRGSPAQMVPNDWGKIVRLVWESLPEHHSVELDEFQIMPNHVHFVVWLTEETGAAHCPTGEARLAPTIGTIVGAFKSECTKQIHNVGAGRAQPGERTRPDPIWQRNYYEHVIRTDEDLDKIRANIQFNPETWDEDRNNPQNL